MSERRPDDAGVAAAAPASSSVTAHDVVPAAARTELDRIRRRWSELSVPRVEPADPAVRTAVEECAARTAPGVPVPDLGPAVLAEQLAVVVWDAYAAGRGQGLDEVLAAVRRHLP